VNTPWPDGTSAPRHTATPPNACPTRAVQAAQGRTKTRLILDPPHAPAVAAIFTWWVQDRLGAHAIAQRLAADPRRYPPPVKAGVWTEQAVYAILRNPKYTGYMVFGRTRKTPAGRTIQVPADEWLWSPEFTHPAIITRELWDAAQVIGTEHATSRDGTTLNTHRQTRRTYVLRSRVRCRSCKRRMSGITRTSRRYWADGPDYASTYYTCSHDPTTPAAPHPKATPAPSPSAKTTCSRHPRLLLPPACSDPTSPRSSPPRPPTSKPAATAKPPPWPSGCARSTPPKKPTPAKIESLSHLDDPHAPAVTALRTRVLARFTELEDERTTINTQLADLTKTEPGPGDPALLDALPMLGNLLADAPARLQQQLYDAFDLQALYKKNMHQVTIHVTITDSTTPRRRRHHRQRRRQPRLHHCRPWRTGPVFGFGTSPIAAQIMKKAADGAGGTQA
jgi:site-specific DNA recombinase